MASKIIRDPLYNYISIDAKRDRWLLELLDTPEVQRLRRIHQLGVSTLTYPGADHNRLAHSLGVVHLMQQALEHLARSSGDAAIRDGRAPVLASALLHDVGHGPFSHVAEACLGVDHEQWSGAVVLSGETKVNQVLLRRFDAAFPRRVAALIDPDNRDQPAWQKSLLSSQLDMDRVDYLRRDSLYTGAGYGHFDWYRLLNTLELHGDDDDGRDLAWSERALLAIEEYIFARYHMYRNVYLHKTTRGFEKMLEAMWGRARSFRDEGRDVSLVPAIRDFWDARARSGPAGPTVGQYLAIEEFTVLGQVQNWTTHPDAALADLARRFLGRERFAMVEAPDFKDPLAPDHEGWEDALKALVRARGGYDPVEMYCLRDSLKAEDHRPYSPGKEGDEPGVKDTIRVAVEGEPRPVEVFRLLPRLESLTRLPAERVRYYVPKDVQKAAKALRDRWK